MHHSFEILKSIHELPDEDVQVWLCQCTYMLRTRDLNGYSDSTEKELNAHPKTNAFEHDIEILTNVGAMDHEALKLAEHEDVLYFQVFAFHFFF